MATCKGKCGEGLRPECLDEYGLCVVCRVRPTLDKATLLELMDELKSRNSDIPEVTDAGRQRDMYIATGIKPELPTDHHLLSSMPPEFVRVGSMRVRRDRILAWGVNRDRYEQPKLYIETAENDEPILLNENHVTLAEMDKIMGVE